MLWAGQIFTPNQEFLESSGRHVHIILALLDKSELKSISVAMSEKRSQRT